METTTRLDWIDGLRGIAVVMVIAHHLNVPFLRGGFIGVDVFFALSGYLITSGLEREWKRTGRVSMSAFYIRRAGRLFPALALMLVTVLTLDTALRPCGHSFMSRAEAVTAVFYATNWTRLTGLVQANSLNHLWSLSVEEHFYLLWPAVFVILRRRLGPTTVGSVALALALLASLESVVLWRVGASPLRLYLGTDTRSPGILLGCAIALVPLTATRTSTPRIAQIVAVFLLAIVAVVVPSGIAPNFYPFGGLLAGLAATLIVMRQIQAPAQLLALPLLVWIGRRSYGLYLWHLPLLALMTQLLPPVGAGIVTVMVTVACAALSERLVETPLLAYSRRVAAARVNARAETIAPGPLARIEVS